MKHEEAGLKQYTKDTRMKRTRKGKEKITPFIMNVV